MVFRNYIKNRSTNNEIVPVLVLSFCKYLIFNVVCSGYDTTAPGLGEARKKLIYYNMSPEERHAYDEHLSAIMIQNDVLDGAKLEGRMEGLEEGMEKGIEKGRMDIARNLKSMGLDIAAIQKATGLLPEEIQKL